MYTQLSTHACVCESKHCCLFLSVLYGSPVVKSPRHTRVSQFTNGSSDVSSGGSFKQNASQHTLTHHTDAHACTVNEDGDTGGNLWYKSVKLKNSKKRPEASLWVINCEHRRRSSGEPPSEVRLWESLTNHICSRGAISVVPEVVRHLQPNSPMIKNTALRYRFFSMFLKRNRFRRHSKRSRNVTIFRSHRTLWRNFICSIAESAAFSSIDTYF